MKNINKLSFMLILMLVIILFPITTNATSFNKIDLSNADLILDTDDSEIGVAFFIQDEKESRTYKTKTKTGTGYFYKKSSGDIIANFNCTGTFSYDGSICNVTNVSTSVWDAISGYKVEVLESKNQISPTYARATGVFNLYKSSVLNKTLTSSATINVYCNQSGDTSVEFNSDDD